MNKYLSLFLIATFLLTSGIIYQTFYRPKNIGGAKPTGRTVTIGMRVLQNQWKWQVDTMQISYVDRKESLQRLSPIPEQATIRIQSGDKVILHIFNEDTYDHGFAVDVLGVNRRLFPKTTTTVEFTPSLSGTFNFYCSVPCGEGHYDQIGTLIVGDENSASSSIYLANRHSGKFCTAERIQNLYLARTSKDREILDKLASRELIRSGPE